MIKKIECQGCGKMVYPNEKHTLKDCYFYLGVDSNQKEEND